MRALSLAVIIGVLCAPLANAQQQSLPYPWNQLKLPAARQAALQCGATTNTPWQQVERCILITVYNNPKDFPHLLNGAVQAVGLSTHNFNCFAFACDPDNPLSFGGYLIPPNQTQFIQTFVDHGWKQLSSRPTGPPPHGTEYAVVYANARGDYEHGALWLDSGVYAKMGELGIFQFSNLDQMADGVYGTPKLFFERPGYLRPVVGQATIQTGVVRHPDGLYTTAQQIRILVFPIAPDGQHIGPQAINPPGRYVAAEGIFHNNFDNYSFQFENLYDAQGMAHGFDRTIPLRFQCSDQTMSC
jgi:hypothetical protein